MARTLPFVLASTLSLALLAACAGGGDDEPADPTAIAGDITVLTQRTDIVDTVFQEYKEDFEALYPDVTVSFEAISDYDAEVSTRMNTQQYGDVLLIPQTLTSDKFATYFEPLGSVDDLSATYRFTQEASFDGQVYGIATFGQASGIAYNKRVFEEAGVTGLAETPEEFLDALRAIKDKTEAIPLYTNYKDGWPLGASWEGLVGVPSADENATIALGESDSPWAEGQDHYWIDGLLFDAVAEGLTEPDPLTTNWEESKARLATGEIGTMTVASWAVSQLRTAAEEAGADPEDIGYLPFPMKTDGAFHSIIAGNLKNAVNVHSEHKAAAKAWVEWFTQKSGYAEREGAVPTLNDSALPSALADLDAAEVVYIELTPDPDNTAVAISNQAEIDLRGPLYRQKLIDIARGAADGDKASYFDELNTRWADARADLG